VSDAQWRAKGLNKQDNIEEALSLIRQVVDVFQSFAETDTQGELRNTWNKIFLEIDIFQDACNAVRKARSKALPAHNLSTLCREYME
jgi:hypothetical protein